MIKYKASGMVLGNFWGGGSGGYRAETLTDNSLDSLKARIDNMVKDGSLDSGMGYESLIGALMEIETIDNREIDGKNFTAIEYENYFSGDLTEEQKYFLLDVIVS